MTNKPVINCHNGWSKLEEVWLGDVYPESWYDHLPNEISDVFQRLTEITKEDLTIIENKIKEFGVTVRRPHYDHIDNFTNHRGTLAKPAIMPRDYFLTLGNTLYCENSGLETRAFQHVIDEYKVCEHSTIKPILSSRNRLNAISGSHSVRAGKDFYIDYQHYNAGKDAILNDFYNNTPVDFQNTFAELFKDYRVHLLFGGGHVDATFATPKPGLLLTTEYFENTAETFPGWDCIHINKPEFAGAGKYRNPDMPYSNGKFQAENDKDFYIPGVKQSEAFNQHVIEFAQNWVGDYTETYFEVNCLVIDEENVLMLGENELVFRKLEEYGVTAHSMPFRTRTFWDGGLHCLTTDIRRNGGKDADYFPDRGAAGSVTVY